MWAFLPCRTYFAEPSSAPYPIITFGAISTQDEWWHSAAKRAFSTHESKTCNSKLFGCFSTPNQLMSKTRWSCKWYLILYSPVSPSTLKILLIRLLNIVVSRLGLNIILSQLISAFLSFFKHNNRLEYMECTFVFGLLASISVARFINAATNGVTCCNVLKPFPSSIRAARY